jgi:hypothetical protein
LLGKPKPKPGGPNAGEVVEGAQGVAEGAEVVAGAGEAGAAEGGMLAGAAAAAGPLIGLAAAALAVAYAMYKIPQLIMSWAESLLDAQRKYAEVSGAMAQVMARWEVFSIFNNQKIGNALAPSASMLESSMEDLMETLTPYIIGMFEALNVIMSIVVSTLSVTIKILEFLDPVLAALLTIGGNTNSIWSWLTGAEKKADYTAANWLNDLHKEYDNKHGAGRFPGGVHPQPFRPTPPPFTIPT